MVPLIVVFDGNPRLTGRFVDIDVREATFLTLFGTVVTNEQIGVADAPTEIFRPVPQPQRFTLPLIAD